MLGFYVTCSSRTPGIVFNISVHVWRRFDGVRATLYQPVPPGGPLPRLDEELCYDTLVPCSVFHVPLDASAGRSGNTARK